MLMSTRVLVMTYLMWLQDLIDLSRMKGYWCYSVSNETFKLYFAVYRQNRMKKLIKIWGRRNDIFNVAR